MAGKEVGKTPSVGVSRKTDERMSEGFWELRGSKSRS